MTPHQPAKWLADWDLYRALREQWTHEDKLVNQQPNHRCPLCGGPNACASAASGNLDTPCWCRGAGFSPALLARVPEAQRGFVCICAVCAAAGTAPGVEALPR